MSYRCEICQSCVTSGTQCKRHVVKKPDGNVECELMVCADCHAGLKSGYSLAQMQLICGGKKPAMPAPVARMVEALPRTVPPASDPRTVPLQTAPVVFRR